MRFILLACLALSLPLLAAETYPLWDGHESVESYAKRVKLPPTKSLVLGKDKDGKDVTLDLVLIPAGQFMMGVPEPVDPGDKIGESIVMILIGAFCLIALVVVLRVKYVSSKRRNFSLGWLLMFTAVGGLFIGGIARGFASVEQRKVFEQERANYNTVPHDQRFGHKVTISKPFYMGKYTVTQAQYETVIGRNPSVQQGPQLPVTNIIWKDAMEFCGKLHQTLGVQAGVSTEAQWEYACRAGTKTLYHSGDTESDLYDAAWVWENAGGGAHPVGMKKPNAFGLYDMHGNVYQLCEDFYRENYYSSSPVIDPPGPTAGHGSELRGGSWDTSYAFRCKSTARFSTAYMDPDSERLTIGFRIIVKVD